MKNKSFIQRRVVHRFIMLLFTCMWAHILDNNLIWMLAIAHALLTAIWGLILLLDRTRQN